MDVTEHPLDKPIQRFADQLEKWLDKWGRRITQVLWKEYQKRPKGFRALFGQKQIDLLEDEELWQQVVDSGYGLAFPFVNEAAYAGFAAGEEMLLNIGAMIDFDLVNPSIVRIGIWDTMELVTGVGNTTRAQLRELMRTFYEAPDVAKNDFIAALEPLFGRTRAEMIAVTEMTNAYASATIETARHAPIETMYEVSTVNDPDVCAICAEAEIGGPYPLDDTEHRPALHPRCRCDAVVVGRPAEMVAPTAIEKVKFTGSEEDKKYWTNQVGQLPEEHLEGITRVYSLDRETWEAGIQLPATAAHRDAAGLRLNSGVIAYKGKWCRDPWVIIHETAHNAAQHYGTAMIKVNSYWSRAGSWFGKNPKLWTAAAPKRFVTRYALTNAKEFFAEHYTAYVLRPNVLKQVSPGMYNLMRDMVFGGIEFL